MGKHEVQMGKQFERDLAIYYGKDEGHAKRVGQDMVDTPVGQVQSGVDVQGIFWGAQAKKGKNFYPRTLRAALDKATRDCGRRIPMVMGALPGEMQDHIVVMRGVDFRRIQNLLIENGLAEDLLLGANFGS